MYISRTPFLQKKGERRSLSPSFVKGCGTNRACGGQIAQAPAVAGQGSFPRQESPRCSLSADHLVKNCHREKERLSAGQAFSFSGRKTENPRFQGTA